MAPCYEPFELFFFIVVVAIQFLYAKVRFLLILFLMSVCAWNEEKGLGFIYLEFRIYFWHFCLFEEHVNNIVTDEKLISHDK